MYIVGLMSGTSLDGIDAALVEIEGAGMNTKVNLLAFTTEDFSEETSQRIRRAIDPKTSSVDLICSLNVELGELFAQAVHSVCAKAQFDHSRLDLVASHGQTLYHLPKPDQPGFYASTLQVGDAAVICERTQTNVVNDFRMRDMAVGGEGAPIVPYTDYLLYKSDQKTRLLQNIGGIGNVTVIPRGADLSDLVAFDTGPGNMIIDALMQHFYQLCYDKNGERAASGKIDQTILDDMLQHPYFQLEPPKTTGREMFGVQYVEELLGKYEARPEDWIATATRFTAESIAYHVKPLIDGPTELIVGGGGSYNDVLMRELANLLPNVRVLRQEDLGYSSEAKEAIAMAILGNETWHHLPSNVPSATGASRPVMLGSITYYN